MICVLLVPAESPGLSPDEFAGIKVVNARTGEGIPLVKLRTHHHVKFYTDNAGRAAIHEPGLMNRKVELSVTSPGYASSGPGWEDKTTVRLTPGTTTTIAIKPRNVAERLYRQNGYGMYRDSHLLGEETPIDRPLMNNGNIMGQDSVNSAVFRGNLYWFWDDTHRMGPMGRLQRGTGATSTLPSRGGLDPRQGVNLDHFVGDHGKAVNLFPDSIAPWIWLPGLMVVEDDQGVQQMFSVYIDVEKKTVGIARWDDHRERWNHVTTFSGDQKVNRGGKVLRIHTEGKEWFYFARPYPTVRVPATAEALSDPDQYEALTPLEEGGRLSDGSIERDPQGNPVWGWRPGTESLHRISGRRQLRQRDDFDTDYDLTPLRDLHERGIVRAHHGTVYWNEHREKWIMTFNELFGRFTVLGDLWYAEADSPIGPWAYARRVVRHHNHSCYNVKQHRMLDQLSGRRIFFECSYTSMFAIGQSTPHYGYNQMMYSLDLSDSRLHLPTPVYHYRDADGAHRYDTLKGLTARDDHSGSASPRSAPDPGEKPDADSVAKHAPIPFYTLPVDRPRPESVPVWTERVQDDAVKLTLDEPADARGDSPVFHAVPPTVNVDNPNLVEIHEYQHRTSGRLRYAPSDPGSDWNRSHLVFRAWESPNRFPPREPGAKPVATCMGASAVCHSSSGSL